MSTPSRCALPDRVDVAVIGGGPAGSTIATLLAGDVHGNRRVWWRLRMFRLIYAWLSLCNLPRAWRARRQRMHNARTVFDRAA